MSLKYTPPKIGFFDSGLGGLSLYFVLHKLLPGANIFYLADKAFVPYGEKDSKEITERSILMTEYLLKMKVETIVVACNTATAHSIDILRQKFKEVNFVGIEPYINVINHQDFSDKKIAVLTTTLTAKSERFIELKKRLDPEEKVVSFSSRNLAEIIEKYINQKIQYYDFESEFKAELDFLKEEKLDYLILGCTHYPLFGKLIKDHLGVEVIDPNKQVAERIESFFLNIHNKTSNVGEGIFSLCETNMGQGFTTWQKNPAILKFPFKPA